MDGVRTERVSSPPSMRVWLEKSQRLVATQFINTHAGSREGERDDGSARKTVKINKQRQINKITNY